MTPRRAPSAAALALSAAAALAPGCSAFVRDDPVQCKTDADCEKRGPDFVGTACATGGPHVGFCVDQFPLNLNGECTANADCVDVTGPGSVCATIEGVNHCERLLSESCPAYVGDPFVERTAIYGVLGDVLPRDPSYVRDAGLAAAAKLAVDEFQADKGVELSGRRRVALVLCSQTTPRSSAAHLVRIGAKAVLGPTDAAKLTAVAEVTAPAGVPAFAGYLDENGAAALPEASGLVFSSGPSRESAVAALSAYLGENAAALLAPSGEARLRVMTVLGPESAGYGAVLSEALRYNGQTAAQNQNDPACRCYLEARADGGPAAVASAAASFRPHVLVPLMNTSWGATYLPAVEAALGDGARPLYLHPFVREPDPGYRAAERATPGALRARVAGLWPSRDEAALSSFGDRYRAATAPAPGPPGPPPNVSAARAYETMQLVLYASYAAALARPGGDFSGADLARAVATVTAAGAARVGPGPLGIVPAVQTLNRPAGQGADGPTYAPIDFDGLLSTFEFDQNQAAASAWQVWCLDGASAQYAGTPRVFKGGAFQGGAPGLCP